MQAQVAAVVPGCKADIIISLVGPVLNPIPGPRHRRKSPQWFGLRREAAELVVRDHEFLPVMREYCVAHRMVDGRCGQGLGRISTG